MEDVFFERKNTMASNTYEMTGAVKTIFEPMTFPSGFMKREFLLTMDDDYPQDVKFQCVKERTAQLDNLQAGERVKVAFRLRCRTWDSPTKGPVYFTDLEAFKVDRLDGDGASVEYEGGSAEPMDDPTPF
jgi:hypothetical protein